MSEITVTIVDQDNVAVAVANDAITVSVADTPIALELYQKQITISATEPINPILDDLWLDIS